MPTTPPTIDMGENLPLRCSLRPAMDGLTTALILVVLFLVLPVAYWADQRPPLSRAWPIAVLMPVGLLGAWWAVACVRIRIRWTIDETHVEVSLRSVLGTTTSRVPRSEYVALVTPHGTQPGFTGVRARYQVVLWHPDQAVKQVVLYAGPSESRFEARLDTYRTLFGLPVNPPGLDIVEVPG